MAREKDKGKKKVSANVEEVIREESLDLMKRSQPSVEIKRDAKGAYSYTVKVYNDSPLDAKDMAFEVVEELNKQLKL